MTSPKIILLTEGICVIVTGGPGSRMSPRAVIRGDVLMFTAMDSADEGEYTCKALNTHGEHTARVSISVQSMLCCTVLYACPYVDELRSEVLNIFFETWKSFTVVIIVTILWL